MVADRLARGKFLNAGQTSRRPDYVLTDPATARALEAALVRAIEAVCSAPTRRVPRSTAGSSTSGTSTGCPPCLARAASPSAASATARPSTSRPPSSRTSTSRLARHAGGDLRPDPADRHRVRPGRGDRLRQRPGQAARPIAVFSESEETRRRIAAETSSGGSDTACPWPISPSPTCRSAGWGERHGQLPRPLLDRDVQPPQGGPGEAAELNLR
ncbi:hypothetical protein LT493_42760 [Streptomyces tricolor]|nr:hypothetical protein [Streptomyces tricolor]